MFDNIFPQWTIHDHPQEKPDCLIVLSYAVKDTLNPTNPTRVAIELAYTWWKRFPGALVILSTGDNQGLGVPNSRIMVRYASDLGIPRRMIIEEPASLTTIENLRYCLEIVKRKNCARPMFVLYDLHARRMVAIARKHGIADVHWVSAWGKGEPAYGIKAFQTYSRLTILLYELMAYLYNRFRGEL